MATQQRADLAFTAGAKITGLPVSTAAGEPVVHQQLTAGSKPPLDVLASVAQFGGL